MNSKLLNFYGLLMRFSFQFQFIHVDFFERFLESNSNFIVSLSLETCMIRDLVHSCRD